MASENMRIFLITFAAVIAISSGRLGQPKSTNDTNYMKETLDDMEKFWKGAEFTFNDTYYSELMQCFDQFNDTLSEIS